MFQFETAIAGSFKFKKESDDLHEEFADYGVRVLEPTKGWLYAPSQLGFPATFRPLPAERNMPGIRAIEERFLAAVRRSDFLYLFNPEQYLGESAAFEVGYADGRGKPIFAREPISLTNVEFDIAKWKYLQSVIKIATPAEIVELMKADAD